MAMLKEKSLLIDNIKFISWDMKLLQEFFSTGIHINILLSTDTIMFGLMYIILVSLYKTSKLQVIYYFNNILKF